MRQQLSPRQCHRHECSWSHSWPEQWCSRTGPASGREYARPRVRVRPVATGVGPSERGRGAGSGSGFAWLGDTGGGRQVSLGVVKRRDAMTALSAEKPCDEIERGTGRRFWTVTALFPLLTKVNSFVSPIGLIMIPPQLSRHAHRIRSCRRSAGRGWPDGIHTRRHLGHGGQRRYARPGASGRHLESRTGQGLVETIGGGCDRTRSSRFRDGGTARAPSRPCWPSLRRGRSEARQTPPLPVSARGPAGEVPPPGDT